jgi:CRISPR type III-B/RAMP module-associated protein Cmr3
MNYQIKLTPIDAYFFGGEKHSINKKDPSKFEMDYYVQSELYPQQTTLLGVLRYYLLMKNNMLSPAKKGITDDADKLIGKKSFVYGFKGKNGETEQKFGVIKEISPLYFLKGNDKYIIAPLDQRFKLTAWYNNFLMEKYDPKSEYNPLLINAKNNSTFRFFKDKKDENDTEFVFIGHETVGNKKGEKGKSEDDGFYKRVMYKLNKGWSFAFDTKIDMELKKDKQFVTVGAEQQLFAFEIDDCGDKFSNLEVSLPSRLKPAIFCISDCFVSEEIWNYTLFSINENVSFRNLQSSNSSKNYSSFSKGYKRGDRYNLLKRGSVLYFDNLEQMQKATELFNNENAQQIGFNQIQQIK